jgi:hypothetical protein
VRWAIIGGEGGDVAGPLSTPNAVLFGQDPLRGHPLADALQ